MTRLIPTDDVAGPTGRICACSTGLPCDGPTRSYRTDPKHGARVVKSAPSHWEASGDAETPSGAQSATGSDPVDRLYQRGDVRPDVRHRNRSEAPLTRYASDVRLAAERSQERSQAPWPCRWRQRDSQILAARAASQTASQAAEHVIPAPAVRSTRAGLNGTQRGLAARAVNVREAVHNGQATAKLDPAPLRGRARRAARKADYQRRLAAGLIPARDTLAGGQARQAEREGPPARER